MDDIDGILKDCLIEVVDFEKRFKTSSEEQNPKVYPPFRKPTYDCEFIYPEDPDTPPITSEVEEYRLKYRQVFETLFEEKDNSVLFAYCTFGDTDTGDADPFANSIMSIFRAYGMHLRLLKRMIHREVSITADFTTVFRRNSMCTKMMTAFAKETGQYYLMDILGVPCRQIFESKNEIIEVEAPLLKSKNIPTETIPENIKNLLARCQQILDGVFNSINQCPGSFRFICWTLRVQVEEKWPQSGDDPWLKAIAGFFFLRFLCPAIITPEATGLTPQPDGEQRRKFVLIAKVIQNLANATSFAGQVKEWEPIDVWIKENSSRILKFFHELSSQPQSFLPFIVTPLVTGLDVLKSLAVLQQMTRVKMNKIVRLIEHDYTRTSNLLLADAKIVIRDIQTFLTMLIKNDFVGLVNKIDPTWSIEGLSLKLLGDTIKSEQYYKSSDPEIEAEKCLTLNWQPDPDDKLLKRLQRETKYKEKKKEEKKEEKAATNTTNTASGTNNSTNTNETKEGEQPKPASKETEEEMEEDRGQLAPLKLLNPVTQVLRLLAEFIPIIKGAQSDAKLREIRRSEKFRAFSFRAFRLQKCDVHSLNNNERKAFWLNVHHLLFLHIYVIIGSQGRSILHKNTFYSSFQYKIGNFSYKLDDIVELLRGSTRNVGINQIDGRVFFAICNFNATSPAFNVYYPDTIDQQLDKAVERVVNEMVETDMNLPGILLPKLFETYSEDLKSYSIKKYNLKTSIQGMEWVKPLLSVDISGGEGEEIIENCYSSLQKLTKNKPEIIIKLENLALKLQLDVQINLPPDETEQQEEETEKDAKRVRMKVKFDDNGFPIVPWPDVKFDQMSREDLIDYIRLCKRSLKQGSSLYAALLEKYEALNSSVINNNF